MGVSFSESHPQVMYQVRLRASQGCLLLLTFHRENQDQRSRGSKSYWYCETTPTPKAHLARHSAASLLSQVVGGRGRRISVPGQPALHSKFQESQEEYIQFVKNTSKTKQPPPKKKQSKTNNEVERLGKWLSREECLLPFRRTQV